MMFFCENLRSSICGNLRGKRIKKFLAEVRRYAKLHIQGGEQKNIPLPPSKGEFIMLSFTISR
jgi:hypothetical protein